MLGVRWHGDAQTHTKSLVTLDAVKAAGFLGRVVADGRVFVRALGAGEWLTIRTQELVQILIAVARWERCTAVTAFQWEWEAAESRVPP